MPRNRVAAFHPVRRGAARSDNRVGRGPYSAKNVRPRSGGCAKRAIVDPRGHLVNGSAVLHARHGRNPLALGIEN